MVAVVAGGRPWEEVVEGVSRGRLVVGVEVEGLSRGLRQVEEVEVVGLSLLVVAVVEGGLIRREEVVVVAG